MTCLAFVSLLCTLYLAVCLEIESSETESYTHEYCSREESRLLAKYFKKHIYPALGFAPEDLPHQCPFNPNYNMYKDQEINKTMITRHEWKCEICGKRFRSEFYLDRHMDNRHKSLVQHDGGCVGDLCSMLGCKLRKKTSDTNADIFRSTQRNKCSSHDLERSKFRCETLLRKCFTNVPRADLLLEKFRNQLCNEMKCVNGALVAIVKEKSDDDEISFSIVLTILSWVLAALLLTIVFIVVFCSNRKKSLFVDPMQRSMKRILKSRPD